MITVYEHRADETLIRGWNLAKRNKYQPGIPPMSKAFIRDRPQLPQCYLATPTYYDVEGEKPL